MKARSKVLSACLVIIALCLPSFAGAGEIDLMPYAISNLTEVLGYTAEEAEAFVFERREGGEVAFWHPDHPDWVYTVFIDRKTGQISGTTPFDTGYARYRGENTVRELMRAVREKGWFATWDREAREEMLALLNKENIRISTELLFAESAGSAAHGFFESCYGPEFGWTEALSGLFGSVLEEYGLEWKAEDLRHPGVRQASSPETTGSVRTVTLFEGEAPGELEPLFADPHLAGWRCLCGASVFFDWTRSGKDTPAKYSGSGLAAFEKDGRRMLLQLAVMDDEWRIFPLGENALIQSGDILVTYDGLRGSLAVEYPSGHGTEAFYLAPTANTKGVYCTIMAYERLDADTGDAVWIPVSGDMPTWKWEKTPKEPERARFPHHLGAVPIGDFPTTLDEVLQYGYPGLPGNCVLTDGVNFRTGTSSRSHSRGMLEPGVVIPVLEVLPGDPNPWIRTRIGFLDGYVAANYTSYDGRIPSLVTPQPAAKAKKEITLMRGTGWLDSAVGSFPAGTLMHVVFEDGDWLYVDVPRGEMTWLMDMEGSFGYVRKSDVLTASSVCQLEWMEE